MKDVFKHFTVEGEEYPFCFNINVIEEIQEEYGTEEKVNENGEIIVEAVDGFSKWSKLLDKKGNIPSMKALKFMFASAINEGIDIENEKNKGKREFVTLKKVGRIMSGLDNNGLNFAQSTVIESTDTGKEKN